MPRKGAGGYGSPASGGPKLTFKLKALVMISRIGGHVAAFRPYRLRYRPVPYAGLTSSIKERFSAFI